MKIPASFQQFGATVEVVFDRALLPQGENGYVGEARFRDCQIALFPPGDKSLSMSRKDLERTFCHELLHWIAKGAGLDLPEEAICVMGSLLHQFLETAEGECEIRDGVKLAGIGVVFELDTEEIER